MRNCKIILVQAALILICLTSGTAWAKSFFTAFEEISYDIPAGFIAQSELEHSLRLDALRRQMGTDFQVVDLLIRGSDPGQIIFIGYAARDLYLPQSQEQFTRRMAALRDLLSQTWLDPRGLFSLEQAMEGGPAIAEQGFLLLNQPDRMAFGLYLPENSGLLASVVCHVFCNGIVVEIHIQRILDEAGDFPAFADHCLDLLAQLDLRIPD